MYRHTLRVALFPLCCSCLLAACTPEATDSQDSGKGHGSQPNTSDDTKSSYSPSIAIDPATHSRKLAELASTSAEPPAIAGRALATATVGIFGTTHQSDAALILDTEDDNNIDALLSWSPGNVWTPANWTSSTAGSISKGIPGTVTMNLGEATVVSALPAYAFDYLVYQRSANCPSGSYSFGVYLDTEDDKNADASIGNISPNTLATGVNTGNAVVNYCFVPKSSSISVYRLSGQLFIANPDDVDAVYDWSVSSSKLLIDLEDYDVQNKWIWRNLSPDYQARVQRILTLDRNFALPITFLY